ncbi:MAG: hypothetical protein KF841_15795 [Phycisphaerae bacterium]|nr:hypothetical protein [Phycisphaerae bacterium]
MHCKKMLFGVVLILAWCNSLVASGVDTASITTPEPADATSAPAASKGSGKPQVEVFIPSVTTLSQAASKSKTARLVDALNGMFPVPQNETGEGVDLSSLIELFDRIAAWPDTAITIAVFPQDRDGRPRWLIRVDWPVDDLAQRVRELLADEVAKELFKGIELKPAENPADGYRLETPDMVLAELKPTGSGAMLASEAPVELSEDVFGESAVRNNPKKRPFLVYCSLNLDAGTEEERGSSLFSGMVGVNAVQYVVSLNKRGEWNEQFGVTWNPLLGAALKLVFQKVKEPFDCPTDAYATAVVHVGVGEGVADMLSGLPADTIADLADSEVMFAVVPGSGFLPVPDLFYVLRTKQADLIEDEIRQAIKKENRERADDDQPPRWREEKIGGKAVFWRDPAADGIYGLTPMTFRSVVFVDRPPSDDPDSTGSQVARLVICNTSTWADDAVMRWNAVKKDTIRLPSSKSDHWQARINWSRAYELAQPYLSVLAGFADGASMPPDASAISDAMSDSDIRVEVSFGGIRARHTGPIPIGAIYVPIVTGAALAASASPSSEIAREQTACRNLRVLHYHAKLFNRDYGRWPANVAELDGYVDFASNPNLLYLSRRGRSFGEALTSALFSKSRGAKEPADDAEEKAVDDSLYVIRWSADDSEWQLKFRDDEFNSFKTIYIDAAGTIHRVPKDPPASATETKSDISATPTAATRDAAPEPPASDASKTEPVNEEAGKPGDKQKEKSKGDGKPAKEEKRKRPAI